MTSLSTEPAFSAQEDEYGLNATMNQIHEIILNKIEEVTQGRTHKLIFDLISEKSCNKF